MTAGLDDGKRKLTAAIAAELLPGSASQPSAANIGIERRPIDRVFKSRPDLAIPFAGILESFHGTPGTFLRALPEAEYQLLLTVLCAAYLMDEQVRQALYYPGQQALTPHRGGFGCEELVLEMMQQPKRYREA